MSSAPKIRQPASPKGPRVYRGVKVGKAAGRSQFTTVQIRNAVKKAIAKHADALAAPK